MSTRASVLVEQELICRTAVGRIEVLSGNSRQTTALLGRTAYGEARHSPQDFVTHHVAAISAAVQLADTLAIRNAAATLQFSLSMSG